MSVPKACTGATLAGDVQTVRAMMINHQQKKKQLNSNELMRLEGIIDQLSEKSMPTVSMLLTEFQDSFSLDDVTKSFLYLIFGSFPLERLRNGGTIAVCDRVTRDKLASLLVKHIDIAAVLCDHEVMMTEAREKDGNLNKLICRVFGEYYFSTLSAVLLDSRVATLMPTLMAQRTARMQTIFSMAVQWELTEIVIHLLANRLQFNVPVTLSDIDDKPPVVYAKADVLRLLLTIDEVRDSIDVNSPWFWVRLRDAKEDDDEPLVDLMMLNGRIFTALA